MSPMNHEYRESLTTSRDRDEEWRLFAIARSCNRHRRWCCRRRCHLLLHHPPFLPRAAWRCLQRRVARLHHKPNPGPPGAVLFYTPEPGDQGFSYPVDDRRVTMSLECRFPIRISPPGGKDLARRFPVALIRVEQRHLSHHLPELHPAQPELRPAARLQLVLVASKVA